MAGGKVFFLMMMIAVAASCPTTEPPTEEATTSIPPLPDTCKEPYSFTIFYTEYTEGENGELIPYNKTTTVHTNRCCEGYSLVGVDCAREFCKNLNCTEDPNSRCALVKRCGAIFPVFVNQHGILSDKCTQPKEAEDHLCPDGGDVCDAGSVCPGDTSGKAVCLGKSCGCTPGPVWYKPNLREVDQC